MEPRNPPPADRVPSMVRASGRQVGLARNRVAKGRRDLLRGTVRAQPHQGEVAEPGFVAETPANRLAGRVELAGLDAHDRAAALADQVLALALPEERVEAGAVAEVNVPDDAHGLEPFEVAVDRGEIEGGATVSQPLGDPLGRNRRVGGEELLEG